MVLTDTLRFLRTNARLAPAFLLLTALSCSSQQAAKELTVVDGVKVHVTSGFSKRNERHWTRMDTAEPIPVTRGGEIPAGSLMRDDGYPAPLHEQALIGFVLRRNTKFGEVTCRGFFEFDTWFDAKWNLRVCPLEGDHVIDGVPCMGTSVSTLREAGERSRTDPAATFYANGKLQKCLASRSFTREGVTFDKWDVIRLDEAGAPQAKPRM